MGFNHRRKGSWRPMMQNLKRVDSRACRDARHLLSPIARLAFPSWMLLIIYTAPRSGEGFRARASAPVRPHLQACHTASASNGRRGCCRQKERSPSTPLIHVHDEQPGEVLREAIGGEGDMPLPPHGSVGIDAMDGAETNDVAGPRVTISTSLSLNLSEQCTAERREVIEVIGVE